MTVFLATNVVFCFLEPVVVRRVGLRAVVVGAAWLMAAGCVLRATPALKDSRRLREDWTGGTARPPRRL